MNHTEKQPRIVHRVLHGFTLVEMMIVLAIISILVGVLVPAMSGYITRSRLNTANSSAKLLFNSLQTICQEYEFADRSSSFSSFYGKNPSGKLILSYDVDNGEDATTGINHIRIEPIGSDFSQVMTDLRNQFTTDGVTVVAAFSTDANYLDATLNVASTYPNLSAYISNPSDALTNAETTTIRGRLARLYDENTTESWIAVIDGYQVRATFCATASGSDYVGAYPLKTTEKNGVAEVLSVTDELQIENLVSDHVRLAQYISEAWGSTFSFS